MHAIIDIDRDLILGSLSTLGTKTHIPPLVS